VCVRCSAELLGVGARFDENSKSLWRGGAEKIEFGGRDEVQLFEAPPGAVMEPEAGKWRVFGVQQKPVIETRILRLV